MKSHVSINLNSISGSSSVGRASAFQAEGRGFESRLPLRVVLGLEILDLEFIKILKLIVIYSILNNAKLLLPM